MTRLYKLIRTVLVTLIIIVIGVPASLYIALSLPWVQDGLRKTAQKELTAALGTPVTIGKVDIAPFNRIRIHHIAIRDDYDSVAVRADNIAGRFELIHLLKTGRINIDYVAIDRLEAQLYKKTPTSPLNIANIIAKLSKKEPGKPPTRFNLALNTIMLGKSAVSYDVLSQPRRDMGFDPSHIALSDVELAASLPLLHDKRIVCLLEHLSAREKSGLKLVDVNAKVDYTPRGLRVEDFFVALPDSRLVMAPLSLAYDNPKDITRALETEIIHLATVPSSYVSLSDIAPLTYPLAMPEGRFYTTLDITGNLDGLKIDTLRLENRRTGLNLSVTGAVSHLRDRDRLAFENILLDMRAQPGALDATARLLAGVNGQPGLMKGAAAHKAAVSLRQAGIITVKAKATGTLNRFAIDANVNSGAGNVRADVEVERNGAGAWSVDGHSTLTGLQGRLLAPFVPSAANLDNLTADATFGLDMANGTVSGSADAVIDRLVYNGNIFQNIAIEGYGDVERNIGGTLTMDDPATGTADLTLRGNYGKTEPALALSGHIHDLVTSKLGLQGKYAGYRLTADIDADIHGADGGMLVNGYAAVTSLLFAGENGNALKFKKLRITADNISSPNQITVESDFLNGHAEGKIHPYTIFRQGAEMLYAALPALRNDYLTHQDAKDSRAARTGQTLKFGSHNIDTEDPAQANDLHFDFVISETENLSNFFGLPIDIIYPVNVDGVFNSTDGIAQISVDAPYLQQKDKIIENTLLSIGIDRNNGSADLYATTAYPTQKGIMSLTTGMTAADNRIDTKISSHIMRDKPIKGNLDFSTLIGRDGATGGMTADVNVNPGLITFGETEWALTPARILLAPNLISVQNFQLVNPGQSIAIDGTVTNDSDSELTMRLDNLELINIFKTLDINNALIGGEATGVLHAREVFSPKPALWTDGLHVRNIGYNDCRLGDADVKAHFDAERGAFVLDAVITGDEGRLSYINGDILTAGALDLDFRANRIPVGFMKPFMSAFAADLSGRASGRARLFGTFHDIDMEGRIKADSLGLKLDFTNTWYYATDSVIITPGRINIDNITLSDAYGHTAKLNGYVTHKCFHQPSFQFKLTDADHLLCYDVPSRKSPDWYGRVFGNGTAFISGRPGVIDISVNMTTTENSVFTFVLSDDEVADDYTFITFRDRTPVSVVDSIVEIDRLPKAVSDYRARMLAKATQADLPSQYNMDIQVGITPAARIILVMDPVGGDEIKATGSGNLRMTYRAPDNELHMYGNYVIDKGSYNFTLQDIIIKDFSIKNGSSISFTGDPYAARLNIKALYSVNANLSDLDESFSQDNELNRTNVPVNAVLIATGDMRQPETSFDLEFPTLNSDIYSKVRSIISTEEMMNRQIIYLLALNRFYTPEYMSTTKGNELFSVASSTISSQLSSMLGKLSENWSIAPNLRSDRGDFSDVEVDVALSSSLLNNRLLFNGNFGYRDKSLNTNQFVGDFDIEYLLNRRGSWRLKAYNRYNDQNYYLRTAQTTQGVGIMFKRDFDNMFGFLKFRRKKKDTPTDTVSTDTIKATEKTAAEHLNPQPATADTLPGGAALQIRPKH